MIKKNINLITKSLNLLKCKRCEFVMNLALTLSRNHVFWVSNVRFPELPRTSPNFPELSPNSHILQLPNLYESYNFYFCSCHFLVFKHFHQVSYIFILFHSFSTFSSGFVLCSLNSYFSCEKQQNGPYHAIRTFLQNKELQNER